MARRDSRVGFWKTPTKRGLRGWEASREDWKANQSMGLAGSGVDDEEEEAEGRVRTAWMMALASGIETWRLLFSAKTRPRKSAPASVAARAASGVLRPQILTSVAGAAGVVGAYECERCGRSAPSKQERAAHTYGQTQQLPNERSLVVRLHQ